MLRALTLVSMQPKTIISDSLEFGGTLYFGVLSVINRLGFFNYLCLFARFVSNKHSEQTPAEPSFSRNTLRLIFLVNKKALNGCSRLRDRKEWDLNPRHHFKVVRVLSRDVPSAAQPSFQRTNIIARGMLFLKERRWSHELTH